MSARIIIGKSPEIRVPLHQQGKPKRINVSVAKSTQPKQKPKK